MEERALRPLGNREPRTTDEPASAPEDRAPVRARRASFAALGFLGVAVQSLVLRELLAAWRGNEMSLGIALGVWLALTGLGSLIGSRRPRPKATRFSLRLAALGALSPVTVLAARFSPGLFGIGPGETAGPVALAAAAVLSLAPFALLSGSLYPAAVSLANGPSGARNAGRVYVLEALGSVVAGLVLSFAVFPYWSSVRASLLAATVAAVAAAFVDPHRTRSGMAALAVVLAMVTALPLGDALDEASLALRWRGLGFAASRSSVHGRVVATRYGSQKSLFENGVLVASAPDRLSSEEAVHIPLLQHPAPVRVLLAGGGLGGSVAEALKHPSVAAIDYVELDPELVRTATEVLGEPMTSGLDDDRVSVHYGDARRFVGTAPGPYDCVIVNVPDPTTLQLNRFYTVGFFEEVANVLAPGGVLGLQVGSSENYLSDDLVSFLGTLRASLSAVFPNVAALPGDPCHMLASEAGLTRDADTLSARIEQRALGTAFVRGYYLRDRLSPLRIEAFDAAFEGRSFRTNTDVKPTAYYQSLLLWNREFSGAPGVLRVGRSLATVRNATIAALALAVALAAARMFGRAARLRVAVVASIALVGATEIALEIAALTAYQSMYGYVYGHVALVTAAFMGGLAAGGSVGTAFAGRPRPRVYLGLSGGIALVPLLLGFAVVSLSNAPAGTLFRAPPVFLLIVVCAALLAGMQFPLAASLLAPGASGGAVGGRLYAADLAGAAIGAPIAAIVMLPVMGVPAAMAAFAILNGGLLVALALALAGRRHGERQTRNTP
jgi:spermidine synthase